MLVYRTTLFNQHTIIVELSTDVLFHLRLKDIGKFLKGEEVTVFGKLWSNFSGRWAVRLKEQVLEYYLIAQPNEVTSIRVYGDELETSILTAGVLE